MKIALLEPEIPQNTGNIGRTCVLTGSELHLIRPFVFDLSDKGIKRAGLDYWPYLKLFVHDSYEDFLEFAKGSRIFYSTTKSKNSYVEKTYLMDDYIMFGKESRGIPEEILRENADMTIRIPMIESTTRSLNLANSVAIVCYEALRQNGFPGLK